MYTDETLENLDVQLGELGYLMKEICNDRRLDLTKSGRWNIEYVRDCIYTAIDLTKETINKRKNRKDKENRH